MDISSEMVINNPEDDADTLSPIPIEDNVVEEPDSLIETIVEEDHEMSVMETLRSLQEENPQVETIFIESDEEENQLIHRPSSKIHEMRTNTPHYNVIPNNPSSSQTWNINQPSTFMVREISPSMLTPNIVSNANTIALFDESKAASSRSYLVIPQNIIPILARSRGPVSLNVPGVGPLVIPKPSDMLLLQKNAKSQISTAMPAPNNDAIAPLGGSSEYHRPYDPLNDPKFKCWMYRRVLKRDLDGYSLNDRLGFNKSEQRRSKSCVATCNGIVKRFEYSINMLKRELFKIQDFKSNTNGFKFVDINKIKGKRRGRPNKQQENESTTQINATKLSATQKKNLQTLLSWKERFGRSNQIDDDLLLTKKVVIVNGAKRRGRKKKQDMDFEENKNEISTKRISRGKIPEKIATEYIIGETKPNQSTPANIEFVDVNTSITPIKRKRGRPKKLETIKREQLHYQQLYDIKPCSVEISQVELQKETLEKYEQYYRNDLISTSQELCEQIDGSKPILVLNEKQCAKINLVELHKTNNLVFPTNEMCFSNSFIEAAKVYDIKFVKPDILCKYLTAGVDAK